MSDTWKEEYGTRFLPALGKAETDMTMRVTLATIATCCGLGLLLSATAHAQATIPWSASLDQAQQRAGQQNRMVLLHFWSLDCPPCRRLEANVFNRPEVASAVHRNYVAVKINVREDQSAAQRFQITRIPTDVILTPDGREVYRTVSPQEPQSYAAMLESHVQPTPGGAAGGANLAGASTTPPAPSMYSADTAAAAAGEASAPEPSR